MRTFDEHPIFQHFDPDNIDEWLEYSPEEFILAIVLEIEQLNGSNSFWSKHILDDGNIGDIVLSTAKQYGDETNTVAKAVEVIFERSRLIERIIKTSRAYVRHKREK